MTVPEGRAGARAPAPAPGESIGALIASARDDRGLSQLRLAELLCAAAGTDTLTRHEVSRWEREERLPGRRWQQSLAAVLRLTPDAVAKAVAGARGRRAAEDAGEAEDAEIADPPPWADDPVRWAHTWFGAPPKLDPPNDQDQRLSGYGRDGGGATSGERIAALRRADDVMGGLDLADRVDRELAAAVAGPAPPGQIAELAQLAGWVFADAGRTTGAVRAYRTALGAADEAGDRALSAHVLGCLSHLLVSERPAEALRLARSALAGCREKGPAGLRMLLLHRIAFASARTGERRASEQALARVEQLADLRDPGSEPSWLYWLDEDELTAMTGRCFVALGRPARGERLLRTRLGRRSARVTPTSGRPRTAALDGGWLAQAYLDTGEAEQADRVASTAVLDAIRAGSPRIAAQVLAPRERLTAALPDGGYASLLAAAEPYLPVALRTGAGGSRERVKG